MFGRIFGDMRISISAIKAERTRMNLIANNLANINTTRTEEGGAYRRKIPIFKTVLNKNLSDGVSGGEGVVVDEIVEDPRPLRKVYKPGHPDADELGYVSFPNVDSVEESVDMMSASRAFDANLNVLKTSREMIQKIIDLISQV